MDSSLVLGQVVDAGAIATRELRKTFRSVKGILLLVLAIVGAVLATLAIHWIHEEALHALMRQAQGLEIPEDAEQTFREKALSGWFADDSIGKYLAHTPIIEIYFYQVALWFAPFVALLLGFDGIPSDLQHKSIRYFSLRTSRPAYYMGKAAGLMASAIIVTLIVHAASWGVVMARTSNAFYLTATWGMRLWIATLPVLLVWCAFVTAATSFIRTPFLALMVCMLVFFGFWIVRVVSGGFESLSFLTYAYPGSYDRFLVSPELSRVMLGLVGPALLVLVASLFGLFGFQRRDV